MSEPIGVHPPEIARNPEHWTGVQFKTALIEMCQSGDAGIASFEQLPKSIELGGLADKAGECRRATDVDPIHAERAAALTWDPRQNKIILTASDKLVVGDEHTVVIELERRLADTNKPALLNAVMSDPRIAELTQALQTRQLDQAGFREGITRLVGQRAFVRTIGMVHSHPNITTFSNIDIHSFLTVNELAVSIMTSTERLRMLVASSEGLPLDVEAEALLTTGWEDAIRQRVGCLANAAQPEQLMRILADDRLLLPLQNQAVDSLLVELAGRLKFGYYRGDDSGVVKRLIPKRRS